MNDSQTEIFDTPSVGLAGQIASVRREINFRERLYKRWVEIGKISKVEAAYEIEAMTAVQTSLLDFKEQHDRQIRRTLELEKVLLQIANGEGDPQTWQHRARDVLGKDVRVRACT